MATIKTLNSQSISDAVSVLDQGGLIGMPTETVYGLAADATNGKAVAKIFEAKGRPQFNPLIVHVLDIDKAKEFAEFTEQDEVLAEAFWPGPLTLILKQKEDNCLSDLVTAGLPTVAIRVPAHKGARALLEACKKPLAAPSANISGTLSPTSAVHVSESLGNKVDLILADGVATVGLESTVVDCTGDEPYILRPGGITAEEISDVLGRDVQYFETTDDNIKSPGQLLKHYAPSIPVRLNAIDVQEGEALLSFGSTKFMGVKGKGAVSELPTEQHKNLSENADLYEAAANLFSMLRALDKPDFKGIAVMNIPDQGIGVAINDRLKRAAQSK
ncbi:MAG: threonylcarbamoyl-AMP synthase [Alphaproteobacteria bacterium]|nr:threonylcarbamoyl-AMP synthase [Alphaproteobacteria bacterium]